MHLFKLLFFNLLGCSLVQAETIIKDSELGSPPAEYFKNWGLAEIHIEKGHRLTENTAEIVVAVIDTGIDIYHPDLVKNLWTNPGESGLDSQQRDKATNHIDDDGNGLIDDVHGWNFAENNNQLKDRHGHGTHIAGIIGANGSPPKGLQGVAPRVKLMILKYYDTNSVVSTLHSTVQAMRYAVKMKAHIINYSAGGLTRNPQEEEAVKYALSQGVLLVAAAGNESSNSDDKPYYPADYDYPNILSVTAISQEHQVLKSSNYGKHSVDIAAPGKDIYSTLPDSNYGFMTGTSQATAFVTGVAALLMSMDSSFKEPQRLIRHLLETGAADKNLTNKTRAQTRLNAYRSLVIQDGKTAAGVYSRNTASFNTDAFSMINDRPAAPQWRQFDQLLNFKRKLEMGGIKNQH